MTDSHTRQIAEILLDLRAVVLSPQQPFTWASGLRSPIYCDNRLLISSVTARGQVIKAFMHAIELMPVKPEVIAGCATAGIPHAAWIADHLGLPMVYVRGSEKKHGRQNRIEGRLPPEARTLVIEDLISTGGSAINAAECLSEAGAEILQIMAVFQYGLSKAKANFAAVSYDFQTLTDLDTLLEIAFRKNYLNEEELRLVQQWRQDPQGWSIHH